MRIVWKEDSAHAVASSLEQFLQEIEMCAQLSARVEEALKEADPDGSNRKLKAIRARFDAAALRLKRAAEDARGLQVATNHMIQAFEDCEGEVIHLLNGLDPGRAEEEASGRGAGDYGPDRREPRPADFPIAFPRPRIAPVMRFSALGPTMGWLIDRMNRI